VASERYKLKVSLDEVMAILADNKTTLKEKTKATKISAKTLRKIARENNFVIARKFEQRRLESICWQCKKSLTWDGCSWPKKPVSGARVEYKKRLGIVLSCPEFERG